MDPVTADLIREVLAAVPKWGWTVVIPILVAIALWRRPYIRLGNFFEFGRRREDPK